MSLINFTVPVTGNFLVDIIKWLIEISSSIALGIVLFTVLLKLITLPFDFFSRASMRKNSLKMEQMRPELEKLQKQYANDKTLYNQKMMALYKKNGYSMFGACLPTIITLVIFIVAINAYSSFALFQDRQYFYDMSLNYNNAVYSGMEIDDSDNAYITRNEIGELVFRDEALLTLAGDGIYNVVKGYDADSQSEFDILIKKQTRTVENSDGTSETIYYLSVRTENGYIEYSRIYKPDPETGKPNFSTKEYEPYADNLIATDPSQANAVIRLASAENNYLKNGDGKYFGEIDSITVKEFITEICRLSAANKFKEENVRFLWVRNIWVTDSPLSHPVEPNYQSKDQTFRNSVSEQDYYSLIAKLTEEQTMPNGYFILAVLTAGISFLTQFVMSRSQKAQMELQTVDGQGARTQKMMMWMMPVMMAVFSFMYTAAFSIYMILSSFISILTTLGINAIIDKRFKKSNAVGNEVLRGRIYNAPEEETNNKKEKDEVLKSGDFIGTSSSKKHIRGRLK